MSERKSVTRKKKESLCWREVRRAPVKGRKMGFVGVRVREIQNKTHEKERNKVTVHDKGRA